MKKGGNNMEGLRLAAVFSLGCTEVVFHSERYRILEKFLKDCSEDNARQVESVLRKLPVLCPYLKLIASCNGAKIFDREVVEAYFIGNEMIENVPFKKSIDVIKEILEKRNTPSVKIRKILNDLSSDFKPHHNFHVFLVAPKVNEKMKSVSLLDLCRVAWGKVVGRGIRRLEISYIPLKKKGERLDFSQKRRKINTEYIKEASGEIEIGNWVALHWGKTTLKLSSSQLTYLEKYTKEALKHVKIGRV
jgi:hydrogenase maturation factor